ncbi:acyl carrier protein [Tenacibaculum jejuense]|uniref:Acyl carrier protein n=1 Tax=Tenacibaculum jejuense TaxID=584609 RepID=A0A238U5S6_9FLAO|nr:phosphopantetheine-binding protein [Tenacibaculum jejuense]SNR13844.1 Acyl carrier protein [Tenacibaculum jejuense]
MGLDSVELIVSIEKTFKIDIPDQECEQIYTVQDLINAVTKRVLHQNNTRKELLFTRIQNAILKTTSSTTTIHFKTPIIDVFKLDHLAFQWKDLERSLQLTLPELVPLDFNDKLDTHVKVLGLKIFKRKSPVTKGNIEQLIDWIISLNYRKIIDLTEPISAYDIQRVVIGIVSDSVGLPVNEIELHHVMTRDLGID